MLVLDQENVRKYLPDRKAETHKGDYGRVLLICGSCGYTGAPYLAAMGALRCGAGMVYLGVPESIYEIEAVKLTEPIVFPLPDRGGVLCEDALTEIGKMLPNMDAVLIGPGLGKSTGAEAVVCYLAQQAVCPLILDADGINLMTGHKDILRGRTGATIITPHEGEFVRLTGESIENRVDAAVKLAEDLGLIVVLKGHGTLITDGTTIYRNPTGNPGMAVAGSGDVLAGVITALVGQGIDPIISAACGAWIHGTAGDLCAAQIGQYGMIPSDMLRVLPRLLK